MKALITGASSGLGADMAKILYKKGAELILVARRTDRLEKLKSELGDGVKIIPFDISGDKNAAALYEKVKNENIDILINKNIRCLCGIDKEMSLITLCVGFQTGDIQVIHI